MQKSKGLVILSFVLIIICVSLTLLVVALINLFGNTTKVPVSYPASYVNPIRIISKSLEKYVYATISKDDTIILKDIAGEKRVLNLEQKQWKDIQFSPDYTLISVLGLSKENQYNLFIYNLATERWEQITSYTDFGVEKYLWLDNDEVLFTQGATDQKWLHSFKYSTKNQILKLNLVRGDLTRTSENKKILVFKDENTFVLRDSNGKLIISSSDIKVDFDIKDLAVLADPSQLILQSPEDKFYVYDLIEETLLEVNHESKNPVLMCSTGNSFKSYSFDQNKVLVFTGSTESLELIEDNVTINTQTDVQIYLEKCNSKIFLIKVNTTQTKWFNNSELYAEVPVLDGDFDADVKIED